MAPLLRAWKATKTGSRLDFRSLSVAQTSRDDLGLWKEVATVQHSALLMGLLWCLKPAASGTLEPCGEPCSVSSVALVWVVSMAYAMAFYLTCASVYW